MARHLFGGSPADVAMERSGDQMLLRPGAVGTVWDSAAGGTQIVDLLDLAGTAITTVAADANASVAFQGPDGVSRLYVDFGYGVRYLMAATDLADIIDAGLASKLDAVGGEITGDLIVDGSFTTVGTATLGGLILPAGSTTLSRSATLLAPTAAGTYAITRLPKNATITAVHGYRSGGTGVTINAQRNGLDLLATDLSLSTDATWMSGPSVQNAAASAGDSLAIAVRSVSGTPAYVTVQIDLQGA